MTSGLKTQTSGVMKEGLMKRLKENAMAKAKVLENERKKKEATVKKEETVKKEATEKKEILPEQKGGFKLLTKEERSNYLALSRNLHTEVKLMLNG